MTLEEIKEAVEVIKAYRQMLTDSVSNQIDGDIKAFDVAVEAMERESCGDCVSRQAVEAIINDIRDCISVEGYWAILERMKKLPSVNPQPEIIRCGQCKYAEVADSEDSQDGYTCQYHRGSIWFSGSYCSWAERRQDG